MYLTLKTCVGPIYVRKNRGRTEQGQNKLMVNRKKGKERKKKNPKKPTKNKQTKSQTNKPGKKKKKGLSLLLHVIITTSLVNSNINLLRISQSLGNSSNTICIQGFGPLQKYPTYPSTLHWLL